MSKHKEYEATKRYFHKNEQQDQKKIENSIDKLIQMFDMEQGDSFPRLKIKIGVKLEAITRQRIIAT